MRQTNTLRRNDPCYCGSGKKYKQCCGRLASSSTVSGARPVPDALQAAIAHHQAGRLSQAEAHYLKILEVEPNHPDALHYLGVIASQAGKHAIAAEFINKAIRANPSSPTYHNNLGNVLRAQGKLDAAIASFLRALSLRPDYAEAHYNLGLVLQSQSRLDEAIASHRKALSFKPDFTEAHNNLGVALKAQAKLDEAIACFLNALSFKPDFYEAHNNLGVALKAQAKPDDAIASFRRALALAPDYADAHYNLANALRDQGKLDEAIASYHTALSFKPDFAEAHYNLGNVLQKQGKPDEAIASLRKALSCEPDFVDAHTNLANALQDRGKLNEAVASYRKALALKPDDAAAYSNLLFAMQICATASSAELLAEHERFAARFEAPLRARWPLHRNVRAPERRLKVGYVSPDFRRHPVAYFIEPVLASHDRNRTEIFCYYNHAQRDEFTDRIIGCADHWLDCTKMTDEQLAARIRSDGIDILVDLAGHTAHNRLLTFARKPAPIQITYLGYRGSSGLAAVDYRLTDPCVDPEGSAAPYTEQLLRLPHSQWCYRPGHDMPGVSPLPARHNGYITFGSFNNFNKIDTPCIELWAQLLRAVPDARLMTVTVPEGESRQQLVQQFAERGVPAQRLELRGKLGASEFYRMLQQVDLTLDPVSVNGATTTCESLWLGAPVLSLVGARPVARAGLSILNAAGIPEFAAATPQQFIGIAVSLAGNLPRLAAIRARLRAQMAGSPLMDGAKFTRELEKLYREIWTVWCNTGNDRDR
ncbi:MAG TPA: tetratricopeptide repeat protein [Burkholderiales bacterium]|nr:tetratricopeptide repeat protein [Burkholderiales bacterium]